MLKLRKTAVVIHSGGMDSSLCLALAIRDYGADNVLSISFSYQQRHAPELQQAVKICRDWQVDHVILSIDCLNEITTSALLDKNLQIEHQKGEIPNTLVVGRNGLMARIGAIHAHEIGAHVIYMGVIEVESANSGYRDCSRYYMDLMQNILRIDLDDPHFEIRTPLVHMTKSETMELGYNLGVLPYLLEETITCYEGIKHAGCGSCPACILRNQGIAQFLVSHPEFVLPYPITGC